MTHIVCFHLLNDYSGSPKVLRIVLRGLLERGIHVDIVTTRGGVLDELEGSDHLTRHTYHYQFSANPALTMVRYLWVQIRTFLMAFRWLFKKDAVFYINTLLPVGPALAGRLMGKRVVYHYHENAKVKGTFYRTLAWLMKRLAHRIICVSEYQASMLRPSDKITVVPNALPREFAGKVHPDAERAFERQSVLMLSSLRSYKGTDVFIRLAGAMPEYRFILVVNDEQRKIDQYIEQEKLVIAGNLTIYPRQKDVAEFYGRASLVLNLSDRSAFIETFGLTALEAMTAGLPVIGPTVGGIAEIIRDGVNGYKTDSHETDKMAQQIRRMLSDRALYTRLAMGALETSRNYSEERCVKDVMNNFEI